MTSAGWISGDWFKKLRLPGLNFDNEELLYFDAISSNARGKLPILCL